MKKIALFMFLACISARCFSQKTEPNTSKGNWVATAYFGNATLKGDGKFKANASIAGGFLGRDFFLNDRFSILAGLLLTLPLPKPEEET